MLSFGLWLFLYSIKNKLYIIKTLTDIDLLHVLLQTRLSTDKLHEGHDNRYGVIL